MQQSSILILGSCGFIGTYCCEYFTAQGYVVTGCDLIEYHTSKYNYHKASVLSFDFESMFANNRFDVCINASGSGNVGYSFIHPQSDFESNTLAVINVLDNIRKHQPFCRLLHISSAAVYGNPMQLPIKETAVTAPLSPYGFHKYMSEIVCKEYHAIYQISVAIIRPFSVYGNGLTKQLLWDICQKLQQDDSIQLFGTGNETRDFIHINDLVVLMHLLVIKGNFDGSIYNGATGIATSIEAVARLFEKYYKGNKAIHFSGNAKVGDPANWQANISSVKVLGFSPAHQLEISIQEYINWFCNNFSK